MKLITGTEAKELDRIAVEEYGMPGILLMDTAAQRAAAAALSLCNKYGLGNVAVLCGKGSNGGDGFGAARWLRQYGVGAKVFLIGGQEEEVQGDSSLELELLKKSGGKVVSVAAEEDLPLLEVGLLKAGLVIDAMIGTGCRGELTPFLRQVCRLVDKSGRKVLAVDVPTGVNADTGAAADGAVRADYTVTLLPVKRGLLLYPGREYAGALTAVDIGVPETAYANRFGGSYLITPAMVETLLPVREEDAHKGDAGRAVICAGSPGFTGAAALAAQAAVKAGAGTVSLLTPLCSQEVLSVKLTEVMVHGLVERMPGILGGGAVSEILKHSEKGDVWAIGPGLGTAPNTAEVIREVLLRTETPVIIDADALTALQDQTELLEKMRAPKLLTPHAGELARLTGLDSVYLRNNSCTVAEKYAKAWNAVLLLKGATTVIACPDGSIYVNITGCSAMATGGSGDVLTGIIAGLAAQGVSLQEAAICGAALHGAAGQTASGGKLGLAAMEIAEALPQARILLGDCFAKKLNFAEECSLYKI